MRYSLLFVLFIFMYTGVFSQENENQPKKKDNSVVKSRLSGRVIDAESNKPIESASVQIYSLKDTTKLVKGAATDNNGNFSLFDFRYGKYELRVSVIGYNTSRIKEIDVLPSNPEVSVGDIKIKTGSEFVTSEISVEAEKNMMEMGIDKKVFNVEKDIMSQSGSATDILRNIPSVTVDSDGNVSLRGSGNVRILINGKPSGLLSTDPASVLEQIPANTIERIEIINNPSAKYDPEGNAGIINIVLKKGIQETSGYNFTLNLNAGTKDKYNVTAGLSYKIKGWNFYGNYSLRFFHMFPTGTLERTNFLSDSSFYLKESDNSYMKMFGHLGTLGIDYDINRDNFIGASVSYSHRDRNRNSSSLYQNYNQLLVPTFYYDRRNYEDEIEKGLDANLNYRKKFEKRGQELTASFQYSNSIENSPLNIIQRNLDFNNNPLPGNNYLENDYTNERFDSYSIQADYTHPLKEDAANPTKMKSKFEVGFKSLFRKTDSDFRVDIFDSTINSFVPNNLLSNDFLYKEQIHSFYGTFENNYKNFGYQVGLRLEEALTNSDQKVTNTTYENNYFSWFPSIFMKQGITATTEAQVSFTRRINRPRLGNLNPFVDYSDPQNLRAGNPYLKPEYINGVELGFVKYLSTVALTSSVFYRITTDVITRYITVDSNGISLMTPKNVNKATSYGMELIGNGSFAKWWNFNASASYFRTELDGNLNSSELNNSGYSWTAKLISNMSFPKIIDIQFSMFLQGKNVTPQGFTDPMFSSDLAVKKDFMNKKIAIGLRISDIFNTQKFGFNSNTETFNTSFVRRRDSRTLFLSFTLRMGTDEKKPQRKKQNQDENKDNEGNDF